MRHGASVLCVLRCTMLFAYFGARFVLEVTFPFGMGTACFDDAYAYSIIDMIAVSLNGIDRVLRYTTKKKPLVLAGLVFKPWRTTTCGGYWALFRLLCHKLDEKSLWTALSGFITFTRVSTGRGAIEQPRAQLLWTCGIRGCVSRTAPWIVRVVVLRIILLRLQSRWYFSAREEERIWAGRVPIRERQFEFDERLIFQHDRPPYRDATSDKGFTVIIPRWFDGDTCYGVSWHFDGIPLPPIFQTLNIRVLGVDAPELRSAKCDLERCLAESARSEMERIVGAGSGRRVQLHDCKHDKYGGRLTCDIAATDSGSAAKAMLRTGLAVEYHGKKKTTSWCDLQPQSEPLRSHVASCRWYSYDDEWALN